MNTKNFFLYFFIGLIFIGSGIIIIATDYQNLREDYKKIYLNFSRNLTPLETNDSEPLPYTEQSLLSDLKMAEEYLKQNSMDSLKKSLDLYNKVFSFAKDKKIQQLAKYGLSYSLYRLNDENRALLHLRELKAEKIVDPVLEEEVDYLLGKILLLRGHDEEGKAILHSLLAKTTSNDLKSRIHTTFGDYYQLKKQYKKAKKSYMIALEHNPDNLHAEFLKENIKYNKNFIPFEHDSYVLPLYSKILKDKEKAKKSETKVQEQVKQESKQEEPTNIQEQIETLKRKLGESVSFMNQNEYLKANNQLIEIEKEAKSILEIKNLSNQYINILYEILENVYFRLGEIAEKQNKELAKTYYDKVLSNPDPNLDPVAYIKKGIIYFEEDKYKEAYQLFKRSLEIAPEGKYSSIALEWLKETEKLLLEVNK